MIRKSLFCIITLAIIVWLAGAYYIKNKLLESLNSSADNNISFSYKDSSIGGFPFNWKVSIKEPKITLISQSYAVELFAEKAEFYFDYDLSSSRIILPKKLDYNLNNTDNFYNYSLLSDDIIVAKISFVDSLYKILGNTKGVKYHIQSIDLKIPAMKAVHENTELFYVNNSGIKLLQDQISGIAQYSIRIASDYESDLGHFKINKAHLLCDLDYFVKNNNDFVQKTSEIFDHKLSINKFLFRFDNSSLDMLGTLKLSRSNFPDGNIKISMTQYRNVIDFLFPEDFIISKTHINKVITKSMTPSLNKVVSNNDDVKFEVNFSDKRILIGNLNLLELNLNK